MPFTFTSTGGSGNGLPGKDSRFLGTWSSVTAFLAVYQGGPVGLADADWWAFVKDNTNPNKVYVVREDANSATGWVIDDNEHLVFYTGQDGQYPNYLGEYNNGASYPVGGIVSIPVGSPYGNPGQLFIRAGNPGNPGYPPGTPSWTEYTNGLVVAGLPAYLPLKSFQEASNYNLDYGYFNHATMGASIGIARTPQVDAYMNYAVTAGVPQSWTFKSFGEHASFTLTLGVPYPNFAVDKEVWCLNYTETAYNAISSGLTNNNEYGLFLTKTGALS